MTTDTKVKRYKGERRLRRGLEREAAAGWQVQDRTSRKMWWRWYAGMLTRSQLHTVTYTRPMLPDGPFRHDVYEALEGDVERTP